MPRVVARVNNPKNEWMFNEMWGVDVAVSTPHLLTALVEEAVSVGTFVRLLSFEGGRAKLAEVTLADGVAGRRQGDPGARPAARLHRGGRRAGRPGDRAPGRHLVRVGDEVLVLVTEDSEEEVRHILTGV